MRWKTCGNCFAAAQRFVANAARNPSFAANTTVSCVMTDPRSLSIHDFTYILPEEKIAAYPLPVRDASRLLIYKNGAITEDTYRHISHHLPPGSLVVFNNTKVIEARLLFQKPTGGVIEIFCLAPHEQYPDITTAMLQTQQVYWQWAFLKPSIVFSEALARTCTIVLASVFALVTSPYRSNSLCNCCSLYVLITSAAVSVWR